METQPLRSKMWSCGSLGEALAVLEASADMPSDPDTLKKIAQENHGHLSGFESLVM